MLGLGIVFKFIFVVFFFYFLLCWDGWVVLMVLVLFVVVMLFGFVLVWCDFWEYWMYIFYYMDWIGVVVLNID